MLELDQLRLRRMKINFYCLTAKEFKPYHRPTSRKRIVIDFSKSNIVGEVADSLNPVTTVPPIYPFSYDRSIQRFQLQVFPGHCLKLSKSLASKLGFMNNYDNFFSRIESNCGKISKYKTGNTRNICLYQGLLYSGRAEAKFGER